MKKILFLLLLISSLSYGQTIAPTKVKITANTVSPSAPFVNVQEIDGYVNKINKSDLVDVIESASAINLPSPGVAGKIYVTKDNNNLYRWNGTFYDELALTDISGKVDKVAGKGLSTEDYTTAEKTKLAGLSNFDPTAINNTLATKVDKIAGKELSTEDYTTAEKTKLSGIQAGATANSTDAQLRDRTTHTGTQAISTVAGLQTALDSKQATLVSGTNIKTIENQALLGSGNIDLTKADVGLANVDNTSDVAKPVSTATQTALNLKINTAEKGAVNGVATLGSDGKVPNNQIPALAISETFPVSSQAQMLALSQADQGDVAIRSDISKSFILRTSPASVLANWNELLTPTDSVISVNGYVGAVTLGKGDIGLSLVDNTSDVNKPVSTVQQNALDLKANIIHSLTHELGGTDVIQGENLSVNVIPPTNNYSPVTSTLKGHLQGIDQALGSVVQTTAGLTNRIYYTADVVNISGTNYYASSANNKGVATEAIQIVVNGDNTKSYFTQDVISVPQPFLTTAPAGSFAGQLSVRVDNDFAKERYTVEIYKTNNSGIPIASGITGAPIGNLGVTVVAILDSGIIDLVQNSTTNIPISGVLNSNLTLNIGERLRYHISAEKIGIAGGNFTFSLYLGNAHNSYYDVPVTFNTDTVSNRSLVTGITASDALNYLDANKENVVNKVTSLASPNNTTYPTSKAVSDNFVDNAEALKSYSSNKKIVQTKKRAIFSFIWDDLQPSDTNVFNIFQEYGYVPNYAIVTSALNSGNVDLYRDFYRKGASILAHSVDHPNMSGTTLTNAQVDAEMYNSKKAIEAYGIRVSGWVTPSSSLNSIYYPQVDKNFGYGFVNPSLTGALDRTVDKLRLSRISLEEAMYGHNLDNVKSIIDDAIANNKLITFYAHSLPSTYLNTDTTPSLTESDLRDILTYLKTKSDDNLCEVLSTDEAVKNYYNNSLIEDNGIVINVNAPFRVMNTGSLPYLAAFNTASTGNMASVNNLFNGDGLSSLTNYSSNRANGVNASTYQGVVNTSVDHRSIYVVGRKIDATSWKESFRVDYDGNFLVDKQINDGSRFQVNGGLSISDAPSGNSLRINRGTGGVLFASPLDLDELALYNKAGSALYQKWSADGKSIFGNTITASPATVDTELATLGQAKAVARPYKVYTALLSQAGTNAPVATVLENTLGGTVVWSRSGTGGNYDATLSGAFTSNKTSALSSPTYTSGNYALAIPQYTSTSTVHFKTINVGTDLGTDDLLDNTFIEIRVYP